jgi:methionyl-tRNA formyltransferase
MGTPYFAIPCLKLLSEHHEIVGVVTTPDKPAGRGKKLAASPIKVYAEEYGFPVLQPDKFKDEGFLSQLKALNADFFAVVAFKILPKQVFEMPPKGTVNLHASLLPKYRGAAPINWALINGDKESGVTTFFIEKNVDTGEILLQEKVDLCENMTAGELHDLLSEVSAKLLLETANGVADGSLTPQKQTDDVTLAPKLTKELGLVDWTKSSVEIHNLIRGLSPIPCAYSFYNEKYIKISKSSIAAVFDNSAQPGTVIEVSKNGPIKIKCGQGAVNLHTIQPQGKKMLSAGEFIRGYRVEIGQQLGEKS